MAQRPAACPLLVPGSGRAQKPPERPCLLERAGRAGIRCDCRIQFGFPEAAGVPGAGVRARRQRIAQQHRPLALSPLSPSEPSPQRSQEEVKTRWARTVRCRLFLAESGELFLSGLSGAAITYVAVSSKRRLSCHKD